MDWLLTTVRRLRLTLLLSGALIFGGIVSHSIMAGLSEVWCLRWGHSPAILLDGGWLRLITSLVLTAGGEKFFASLAMLAACVGVAEYRCGTMRSFLTFFGTHIVTLLLQLLLIQAAASLGTHVGQLLMHTCDVGPSAGYYGCLGLVVAKASPTMRVYVLGGVLAVLVGGGYWSYALLPESAQTLSADLAHAIAFPIGYTSAFWIPASGALDASSQ